MKKKILTLATVCLLAAPGTALGQGFGVAARIGTLGAGVEGAFGLTNRLVVRGGIGLLPLKPSTTINNIDFTLTLPKTWYNIGLDFYVAGPMRIGAGMLFKSDNPYVDARIKSNVTIGNVTYTPSQVNTLHAVLASNTGAPYVLIGFGKHTSGMGLFLDLGVAFMGKPTVHLSATGDPTVVNSTAFQTQVHAEETTMQNDAGTYLKLWPILNLGFRIGLGH